MSTHSLAALLRAALLRRSRAGVRGSEAALAHRGDGYEFAELRAYAPGDDLRRIDWAATARVGALQTRVVFEERGLTLAACIDASPSMQLGCTRSNYALACEAARLWFALANGDDRCARIEDDGVRAAPALRGDRAAALCSLPCADAPRLSQGLAVAAQALGRAASLLVISDFFELDANERLLRACARRFDLTALLVRDPWHGELPLRGLVALQDAETGRRTRIFLGEAQRRRYREAISQREQAVCARLTSYGARAGLLSEDAPQSLLQAFGVA